MRTLTLLTVCAGLLFLGSCGSSTNKAEATTASSAAKQKVAERPQGVVVVPIADQKKAGIEVIEAKLTSVPQTLTVSGHITLNQDTTYHVSSLVPGKVASVSVNVGDQVKAGDVLALIKSDTVHETRVSYVKTLKEISRLEDVLRSAERIRDRAARLYQAKAGSKASLDQAEVDVKAAKTAIEATEIEKERARDEIEDYLKVSLPDAAGRLPAGDDPDDIFIKSPGAGIVTLRNFTVGKVAQTAEEGFGIADMSTVWMIASVHEIDMARARVGSTARVTVQSYPGETFTGRVTRINVALDPETRTVQVRILVPNTQGKLRAEMYAKVDIQSGGTKQSILLPEAAIQTVSGVQGVFIRVAPDQFEPRPVTTGALANGQVEIAAGVNPGDTVVVKGGFLLKASVMRRELEQE